MHILFFVHVQPNPISHHAITTPTEHMLQAIMGKGANQEENQKSVKNFYFWIGPMTTNAFPRTNSSYFGAIQNRAPKIQFLMVVGGFGK